MRASLLKYSDDQERDDHGRWSGDGSSTAGSGTGSSGADRSSDGGSVGSTPSYQRAPDAGPAAVAVLATHFSSQPRTNLSSSAYGTGLKGFEQSRLNQPGVDPRLKQRTFFYVNEGNGVRAEAGVGAYQHQVRLGNVYDGTKDGFAVWRQGKGDPNLSEKAVLDAGYDGYISHAVSPSYGQGNVVLLGAHSVPVKPLGVVQRARLGLIAKYSDDQPRDDSGKWTGGTVYHATRAESVGAIQSGGLAANSYVTNQRSLAESYARSLVGPKGNAAVLTINVPANRAKDFVVDADADRPGTVFRMPNGLIPSTWISPTVHPVNFDPSKVRLGTLLKYSDDQPRDEKGRWASSSGEGSTPGGGSRSGSRMDYEVAPNPNNVALTARWNTLTPEEKLQASEHVAAQVTPHVLQAAGVTGRSQTQQGGYMGATNPSFAVSFDKNTSGEKVVQAAALLGSTLQQDSMLIASPHAFPGSTETGVVTVHIGHDSPAAVYDRLWGLTKDGEHLVGGHSTLNGQMNILNLSGMNNEEFAHAIDRQLKGSYDVELRTGHFSFLSHEDYGQNLPQGHAVSGGQSDATDAGRLRSEASAAFERELRRFGKAARASLQALLKYSDDQERDEHGRWTGGGGTSAPLADRVAAMWAKAGGGLGMHRENMPQVPKGVQDEFFGGLRDQGVKVAEETVSASSLKPVQVDYKLDNIEHMMSAGLADKGFLTASRDNYIIDGHHRWVVSALEGLKIRIMRVDLPAKDLLQHAEAFNVEHGVERRTVKLLKLLRKYSEDEQRDDHGRWTDGAAGAEEAILGHDLHAQVRDVVATLHDHPPEPERQLTPEEHAAAATELRASIAEAAAQKPAFDEKLQALAHDLNARVVTAPLKSGERLAYKHVVEYNHDATLMRDIVRGSVIVKTEADVKGAIDAIGQKFEVTRIKNRFDGGNPGPMASGYRDVLINVRLGKVEGEIQVHIPEMFAVKMTGEMLGHGLYEVQRQLPPSSPQFHAIDELSTRVYRAALEHNRGKAGRGT